MNSTSKDFMPNREKVAIIGGSSHAMVIADALLASQQSELLGFAENSSVFDSLNQKIKNVTPTLSFPIFNEKDLFHKFHPSQLKLILGLGSHLIAVRERLIALFTQKNFSFATAIHPLSTIAPSVVIREGSVVFAGCILNPYTVVEKHAVINTGACIDHECLIGENSFILPRACLAGKVIVGKNSMIGMGANIKEGITIGSNSIIGAGAFVNSDVPDNCVYIGIPAKKLRDIFTNSSKTALEENS